METENVSKAQTEVWEWKELAAESVMALPPGERIRFILERTHALSAGLKRGKRKPAAKKPTRKRAAVPVA
ncbi:MAG: hypothetical protein ACK4Q5_08360 [Saprospiraceae bacterium]